MAGISIHAPREGGDILLLAIMFGILIFQSTPPARGATKKMTCYISSLIISIHAPREGGDCVVPAFASSDLRISIHAPREGGDSKDAQFYL